MMRIISTLVFLGMFVASAPGQTASPAVLRLTVMITRPLGPDKPVTGTGFVVGEDRERVYIITAGHVAGVPSVQSKLEVEFDNKSGAVSKSCLVIASSAKDDNPHNEPNPDIALIDCPKSGRRFRFSYDVLGNIAELRRGQRLMMIGNLDQKWGVPLGHFLLADRVANVEQTYEIVNPSGFDLRGSSGGPVLTDRSEFIGMQYRQPVERGPTAEVHSWTFIRDWLEKQAPKSWVSKGAPKRIRLSPRARSAPALVPGNIELSASVSSIMFPSFGWLTPAPKLRIGVALPSSLPVNLSLDFTYTRSTKGVEEIVLTVPSAMAELAVGSILPPLRRRQVLGGVYLAAGIAPVGLQRTFERQVSNTRSWYGIFDAGWRYRFPGRSWGLSANYRESVQPSAPTAALYPRFRAVEFGTFILLK